MFLVFIHSGEGATGRAGTVLFTGEQEKGEAGTQVERLVLDQSTSPLVHDPHGKATLFLPLKSEQYSSHVKVIIRHTGML